MLENRSMYLVTPRYIEVLWPKVSIDLRGTASTAPVWESRVLVPFCLLSTELEIWSPPPPLAGKSGRGGPRLRLIRAHRQRQSLHTSTLALVMIGLRWWWCWLVPQPVLYHGKAYGGCSTVSGGGGNRVRCRRLRWKLQWRVCIHIVVVVVVVSVIGKRMTTKEIFKLWTPLMLITIAWSTH